MPDKGKRPLPPSNSNSNSNSNVGNITNLVTNVMNRHGVTRNQAIKMLGNRPGPSRRHKRVAAAARFPQPMYRNGSNRPGEQVFGSLDLTELLAKSMKNNDRAMAIFRSLSRMQRTAGYQQALPATFDRRASRTQTRDMTMVEQQRIGGAQGQTLARLLFGPPSKQLKLVQTIPANKLEHFTRGELQQAIERAMVTTRINVHEFMESIRRARRGILVTNQNSEVARELGEVLDFLNSLEGVPSRFWQENHAALVQGLRQRRLGRYTLYVIALFLRVPEFTAQRMRARIQKRR